MIFVHGLLKRAINTFGNFFSLAMDGGVDDRQRAAISAAPAQERLAKAADLAELRRALTQHPGPEEAGKRLDAAKR